MKRLLLSVAAVLLAVPAFAATKVAETRDDGDQEARFAQVCVENLLPQTMIVTSEWGVGDFAQVTRVQQYTSVLYRLQTNDADYSPNLSVGYRTAGTLGTARGSLVPTWSDEPLTECNETVTTYTFAFITGDDGQTYTTLVAKPVDPDGNDSN